jgi:16S rRNA (cytosine1402-N4)-methyltransferase
MKHDPVLLNEVLQYLQPEKFAHSNRPVFIDATVGYGGHAKEFIKRGVFVIGIDTDETTLKNAYEEMERACPGPNHPVGDCFKLLHGNFKDVRAIAERESVENICGILIDLGVSTPQLTSQERGLSFQNREADLDMRLDTESNNVRGYELLNVLNEKQLLELFLAAMEYPDARKLVRSVVRTRNEKPFRTVGDFLDVIPDGGYRRKKTHPATKPFMALRMAVNSEIPNVSEGLPNAFSVLKQGGRLAVISFHSGEDLVVKDFMKDMEIGGTGKIITKKPIVPSEIELSKNQRARSAKLRVIEKI